MEGIIEVSKRISEITHELFRRFHCLSGLPSALGFAGAFLLYWGYGCFFETLWNGRTPGKRALKLRVIKTGGYPIGFYDALLRNLLRVVDGLPVGYGIGLVSVLVTRRFQRLGDLAAGTLVIHERPARHVYPPWVEGVAPFEPREMGHAYRPAERTLDLIEGFLSRAQGLSDERADEIAQLLAEPLRHKLGIADPGGEHLRAPGWFLLRVLRTFVYPPNHPYGPSGAVP